MYVQTEPTARGATASLGRQTLSYFNCVDLISLDPLCPTGAHIFGTGTADDHLHYHLKGCAGDCLIALNEHFLTHLARLAKLPTVACKPVRYESNYYFGSETLSSVCPPTEIVRIITGKLQSPGAVAAITRSLAFDLLMGNPDRHYKNFVIQKRADDSRTIRIIDFSTGGLMSPCWRTLKPLSDQSETVKQLVKLRGSLGTDIEAGRLVLTTIGALPENYWARVTDQFPPGWTNSSHFDEFTRWWIDGRRDSLELANRELDKYA